MYHLAAVKTTKRTTPTPAHAISQPCKRLIDREDRLLLRACKIVVSQFSPSAASMAHEKTKSMPKRPGTRMDETPGNCHRTQYRLTGEYSPRASSRLRIASTVKNRLNRQRRKRMAMGAREI